MNLTSERLIYIPVTETEWEGYKAWYTNDDVMKYVTGKGLTEEQTKERFAKAIATNQAHPEVGLYLVKDRNTDENIGIAKLAYMDNDLTTAEVGYGMMPKHWGVGYASEMLRCLVSHSRTLPKVKTLIGIVNPKNGTSVKVLTKQDFNLDKSEELAGTLVEYYKLNL